MNLLKSKVLLLVAFMVVSLTSVAESSYDSVVGQSADTVASSTKPKVYMTRDISPESLVEIYKALGRKASGRVAVKLSTGEPGGNNFLQPALIGKLVKEVNGTIVECNTAYGGGRANTEAHMKAAEDHGFTKIAKVDIMDADGEVKIPVKGGSHIDYDIVGKNFMNYDFVVVLSHFKGHAMAGFGGAIKNISIGIASANGKRGKAVADKCGDRILYISVMNNLSVDCDCDAHPAAPQMGDIGILASLDPVALDKACVDLVRNSSDEGKVHLIERIDSRKGMTTLVHAEEIGLGSQEYELVEMK